MDCMLNNGRMMPSLALGTWRTPNAEEVVKSAIDCGFRHIDCAHSYDNEQDVGRALQAKITNGNFQRKDLFITSKLWNTFHSPEDVKTACQKSLEKLCLDYLDLYLIHYPMAFQKSDALYPRDKTGKILYSDVDYTDTWKAMENLIDEGIVRSIGLSNFNATQIDRILKSCRHKPVVLQVECHPYLNQKPLMDYCSQNSIIFTAYSPLGSAHTPYKKAGDYPLLQHPIICEIAKRLDRSPAQVLLRYQLQRGNTVVTRSTNPDHMKENMNVFDFILPQSDQDQLDSMDINGRFMWMPDAADHPHYPFKESESEKN